MPIIKQEIYIDAPREICFQLARDIETHTRTTASSKEKAVGGKTSGLLEKGDTVTWEATHLGIRQQLTAKITEMEEPHRFIDEMVTGAFHSFTHIHTFISSGRGTIMKDRFAYKSPLGLFGILADKVIVKKYMQRFLASRADELKRIAEEKHRG